MGGDEITQMITLRSTKGEGLHRDVSCEDMNRQIGIELNRRI